MIINTGLETVKRTQSFSQSLASCLFILGGFMTKTENRFWSFVCKCDINECWLWTGAKFKDNYGAFWVDGKSVRAHRVSYELAKGKITDGLCVLHKCDNPLCVNPNHLFMGSDADNVRDCATKNRRNYSYGENNGSAKLSGEDILRIRELLLIGISTKEIGNMYGVSQQSISLINTNKTWKMAEQLNLLESATSGEPGKGIE